MFSKARNLVFTNYTQPCILTIYLYSKTVLLIFCIRLKGNNQFISSRFFFSNNYFFLICNLFYQKLSTNVILLSKLSLLFYQYVDNIFASVMYLQIFIIHSMHHFHLFFSSIRKLASWHTVKLYRKTKF